MGAYNAIVERVEAVLDTSFWLNAAQTGLTAYLLEYFRLWAPPAVAREATALLDPSTEMPSDAARFAEWMRTGDISIAAPGTTVRRFDPGENEAIALALERGWLLLIDDQQPRHFSRGPLASAVVDSPALTVFLYDQDRIPYDEAVMALHRSNCGRHIVRRALVEMEFLRRAKEPR